VYRLPVIPVFSNFQIALSVKLNAMRVAATAATTKIHQDIGIR